MWRSLATALVLSFMIGGSVMSGVSDAPASEAQAQGSSNAQAAAPRLADEMAIRLVIDEIDNAVDAKNWARCREFFTDEIDVDFSSLAGGAPAHIKADELVGGWRKNLYSEKKSHHMRSNHRITVNGDKAEVFSKGYALNILPMKTGGDLWEVWGDYRHTLERTARGWRVTGMTLNVTHARGNERVRDFVPQP